MNEAQNRERRALAELIAARKMFQKAVSDNPDAFAGDSEKEDVGPTADTLKTLNEKKLSEMAEFRNEAKAAQQFVEKTLQQQRTVEQATRTTPRTDYARLGDQERQLQKSLADFEQLHPRPFKGTQAEAQQTQEAMNKAADSLKKGGTDARAATQQAAQQLEKLSRSDEERDDRAAACGCLQVEADARQTDPDVRQMRQSRHGRRRFKRRSGPDRE